MAEDIAPGVEIEGTEEALAKLTALGEGGQAAFNKIAEAAEKVGNSTHAIDQLAEKAKSAFTSIGETGAQAFSQIIDAAMSGNFTGVVTNMFGELAGSITEVTEKAIAFVEAQASMAETMSNLSEATGMTLGQIGGLRDAFASVGISTNGFERSVGRLAITIASEWSQIQQSVRTSADSQLGAMLALQSASNAVGKAYTSMNEALSHASQSAAHDAIGIREAALSLRKAQEALSDSALTARSNALSVESAELALVRARMNLRKDQGYAPSAADEQALKLEQDKLAVKEAELRLDEAKNKKQKEGMEMEELALHVQKAKMEVADAQTKQQEDAVKAQERLKDAALGIDKAQLARREAQEKSHEADLKDIPKIAKEIDSVAEGQKKWADVINHTEISAQNMTKALLLAASPGDGKEPAAMDVFKTMSKLFQNMGDDADSMNKKLELVQHTMGAGFRAGQASAAQVLAVLERGPEVLNKFMAEAEKFSKVKIGNFDLKDSYAQLKEFNSASSQLATAFDQVKTRFAAMMAVPLAQWFEEMKNSIYQPEGALRQLAAMLAEFGEKSGTILAGIGKVVADLFSGAGPAFSRIGDMINRVFGLIGDVITAIGKLTGLWAGVGAGATAFSAIAVTIDAINIALDGMKGFIAGVLIALGELYAWYLKVTGQAKTLADARKNEIMQSGKDMMKSAAGDLKKDTANLGTDAAAFAGLKSAADKTDKAAEKVGTGGDKVGTGGDKVAVGGDKVAAGGDKLAETASTVGSSLGGAGDKLSGAASELSKAAAALVAAIANLAKAKTPDATGKATGGKISGPGGPRDDTAGLFALSDGEFVVQSAAVSHYGEGLFNALNSLSVGGFATGGSVGRASAPSLAAGTASGPMSVLNLKIGDHEFNGLKAPEHVASKLKTFAVGRQSSSAGKLPSWNR